MVQPKSCRHWVLAKFKNRKLLQRDPYEQMAVKERKRWVPKKLFYKESELCSKLGMEFDEIKEQVCNMILSKNHVEEDDLLIDLTKLENIIR